MRGSSRRLRLYSSVAFSALFLIAGANNSAKAEASEAEVDAAVQAAKKAFQAVRNHAGEAKVESSTH